MDSSEDEEVEVKPLDEQSIKAQFLRIEKLTKEVEEHNVLEQISPERKEYLHLIFGFEKSLDLTFDPARVPLPNDFVKKAEEDYQKQVRKGVVYVPPKVTHTRKHQFISSIYAPPPARPQKEIKYSWIPMSEIHTARTKIDSFVHLPVADRKKLHEKFASMVVCLISQFESMGTLSDDHITPEQAAALTAAFSDALSDIQTQLFQPISRKHTLDKRGPLFQPKKTYQGRHIKYRNHQTLSDISKSLRKKTAQLEKNGNEIKNISDFDESIECILPPQYRPVPINKLPKMNKRTFSTMCNDLVTGIDEVDKSRVVKVEKPARRKPRHRTEVLVSPRKQKVPPPPPPPPPPKKPEEKDVSFNLIKHPENKFFEDGDFGLRIEPIAGVETEGLEGLNKLFTRMKVTDSGQFVKVDSVDPLEMPHFDRAGEEIRETSYLFKPSLDTLNSLLDTTGLFTEDDNGEPVPEHQSLTDLWEQLHLHPDSRLLMAGRLCSIISEDPSGDYHFKTIISATSILKKYTMAYKAYRDALRYEPIITSPEKHALLSKLTTDFKITESAFINVNQELRQILSQEISTKKGTLTEIVKKRAKKIQKLRIQCGIDKPKNSSDESD